MIRILAFFMALGLGLSLAAQSDAKGRNRVYSVIFAVDVDAQGQITGFNVEKVIDPKSGSTAAANVPVPDVYIEAARKKAAANAKAGEAKRYFTYYFFDPRFPESADVFPGR